MRLVDKKLVQSVAAILGLTLSWSCPADDMTWEYCVQVSATIQRNPPAIRFSWPQDQATTPDYYTVSRKAPDAPLWGLPVILPGGATNYADADVSVGVPYEYQFYKHTSTHVGYGYITAGIDIPVIENRGKLILLVDQTFAGLLEQELRRLQDDLTGDGWLVMRHDVPRDMPVPAVKAIIKADYDADAANTKGLFLFGRIPVPYSGDVAPDGHPLSHSGAWAADTFYGDMDGVWTDNTVTDVTSEFVHNWNLPGDGKYDQSEIPGTVRLQIGRVDLSNMPGLETNGVPTFPSEGELLRQYLNKDHNYRHKVFSLPARGLVYNQTGDRAGEAFADDAWRNWAPLLGPPRAQPLQSAQFLPILQTNGYQWSYATGGGSIAEMGGLGGTRWQLYWESGCTLDLVEMDIQTSFVMLLGSALGDWDLQDNLMRAVLATPTYGLACVYAGRPHWFFHPMGLGETLGYCARLTQNNHADGLYRNESNNFAGFVHVALLGDPTLRQHIVAPPRGLAAQLTPNGTLLSWQASADDVLGYHVYRAPTPAGPFTRLTAAPLPTTTFMDVPPPDNWTYMVRALKLQQSASGSYFNPSQGVFVQVPHRPILSFSPAGTNLAISWTARPGQTYRVLWSDSILRPDWHALSPDLLATNPEIHCLIAPSGVVSGSGWTPANNFVVWVDDALPEGAAPGPDSAPWTWVGSAPLPFSGAVALQSSITAGLHQQYFTSTAATMTVNSNDVLCAQVYLDPANLPSEIMLQWNDGTSWEHRAYWGANLITYGQLGTATRMYKGPLPPAGRWSPLEVPASEVGLAGATVTGLAFTEYDGRATWDSAGKRSSSFIPPNGGNVTVFPGTAAPQSFYKVLMIQ